MDNAIRKLNHFVKRIKFLGKYLTKDELLKLVTSQYFSMVYYTSPVWIGSLSSKCWTRLIIHTIEPYERPLETSKESAREHPSMKKPNVPHPPNGVTTLLHLQSLSCSTDQTLILPIQSEILHTSMIRFHMVLSSLIAQGSKQDNNRCQIVWVPSSRKSPSIGPTIKPSMTTPSESY